jgi:hypothetical protein
MKTPKEKAEELVEKYSFFTVDLVVAKQCALIAVDETIEFSQKLGSELFQHVGTESYLSRCKNHDLASFYKQVKQEIEKL